MGGKSVDERILWVKTYLVERANSERKNRWYFGGVAAAMGVCVTHPLDLIKVHLQTQHKEKTSIMTLIKTVYRTKGITGFYNGLSASVLRQLTYSTTRIGIYEVGKGMVKKETFWTSMGLAVFAGTIGGVVGVPMDLVNVRMQNDMKLPPDKQRNYKHAIDGLIRIYREEGFKNLFTGASPAVIRGVVMTIGQNVVYDQAKIFLMSTGLFNDNIRLHFLTSTIAAGAATVMTQPLDVVKTRSMNAKPGEFRNILEIILYTAQEGPLGFFRGFVPALVRLGPQTILLFMFMEQMRLHFGYFPDKPKPTGYDPS